MVGDCTKNSLEYCPGQCSIECVGEEIRLMVNILGV